MRLDEIEDMDARYVMGTYRRLKVAFERGRGAVLYDTEGKGYIDLVAGIAVNVLGHSHPALVRAICEQAGRLMHTSNLYYIRGQAELAQRLCEISHMDKAFFCNSGAEAIEGAMKLARRTTGRERFVACEHSFHGRTMGALSATYKPESRLPFMPLLDTSFVPYGDAEAAASAIDESVAAFLVEPVQGEGGVNIPPEGYLRAVRDACDDAGALLVLDEVQTGYGRCGRWFAKEHFGVEPDIMTVAKAMAGGYPMGAVLSKDGIEFSAGEHGSTFAGSHLACACALTTINTIEKEHLVERAASLGGYFLTGLKRIESVLGHRVVEARGLGLMLALELDGGCADVVDAALEHGLVFNCTAQRVLRFVPPLVIEREHIDRAINFLEENP
ncbi:MAG: acetylornithine/succinylornithine family transaminase [Methermicoccaceae archaeon]